MERPKEDMILVIVHNADGRPCGWGMSISDANAREAAEVQYGNHSCYRGEKRGKTTTTLLPKRER